MCGETSVALVIFFFVLILFGEPHAQTPNYIIDGRFFIETMVEGVCLFEVFFFLRKGCRSPMNRNAALISSFDPGLYGIPIGEWGMRLKTTSQYFGPLLRPALYWR